MGIRGNRVECVHDEPRAGDMRDSLRDISRAHTGSGYVPRYGRGMGLRRRLGGLAGGLSNIFMVC